MDFHKLVNSPQGKPEEVAEAQRRMDEVQNALDECERTASEARQAANEARSKEAAAKVTRKAAAHTPLAFPLVTLSMTTTESGGGSQGS